MQGGKEGPALGLFRDEAKKDIHRQHRTIGSRRTLTRTRKRCAPKDVHTLMHVAHALLSKGVFSLIALLFFGCPSGICYYYFHLCVEYLEYNRPGRF